MKKIIIWIIILILILSWLYYHNLSQNHKCEEIKNCTVDCWFDPNYEDNLKKCEKENTYILKYFN